jgi:acetyl esterase
MIEPSAQQRPSARSSLSVEAANLMKAIQASGFPGWAALGVEQGRAAILQMKEFAGPPPPVARVEQISLPETHAMLYVPASSAHVPVLVYMHGGGWVLGGAASVDSLARWLAIGSGCAVLSVDYRLAPEHKYPAALNDVVSALDWAAESGPAFGIDASRIAVGGDSSGANLATAAALVWRERGGPKLAFQLLVYGVFDHDYETPSFRAFGDGDESALSRTDVAWFHRQYVNRAEELDLPYVSPLRTTSLQGLPATLVICAEIDPLLHENREYGRRLEQAGIPVELLVYPGMFHGFWRMGGVLEQAKHAINHAAARLSEATNSRVPSSVAVR